jgi:alkylated DNA repair dioxygenase AlkB
MKPQPAPSPFPGLNSHRLDLPDATVVYHPGFLSAGEAGEFFERLHQQLDWRSEDITLFGKRLTVPRLTAWYGDPGAHYTYSRLPHAPLPWTDVLLALRVRLEAATGHPFNGVLCNLYRDGADSMAWHSDDEPELGDRPVIASLSLGATRKFRLRHKRRKDLKVVELPLEDGSLLLMAGETQQHWEHEVRKSKAVTAPRINLTFRYVRTSDAPPRVASSVDALHDI